MKIKRIIKSFIPFLDINQKIYQLYKKENNWIKRNHYISKYYNYKLMKKFRCCIAASACITDIVDFPHPIGITIGEGVVIGKNVKIYQNVTIGKKDGKYPQIMDNVIIYPGAVIIGDITINKNSIIGANSVVLCDVPENTIYAGNPAKEIKK